MDDGYEHTNIGKRLKILRGYLGYQGRDSQKKFAIDHGFGVGAYSHWETGRRRISLDSAAKLRALYGVTLDWIYPVSYTHLTLPTICSV